MINPFLSKPDEEKENIQEELITLRFNPELKLYYEDSKTSVIFWQNIEVKEIYPKFWNEVAQLLLYFPTSYCVECGFSILHRIVNKERNRLDMFIRGDIRSKITQIEPDIESLVKKHQSQGVPLV
ncbi:protein FAM200A-like [Octopus sinensis]|uniref:Protein FAM200A-like n=1 Tax=Octopus sinensis TaxID=2607531 RepID=A0A6P7U7Z1_9MOLL|nr:protein FAM200A-like [Octopus sinensis]